MSSDFRPMLNGDHRSNWGSSRLGDLVDVRVDRVSPSAVDPSMLCVDLDDIGRGDGRLRRHSTAGAVRTTRTRFYAGDVLFGRLRPYQRKYWRADEDGICTTEIWPLVPRPSVLEGTFLWALVQSNHFGRAADVSYGTRMPRADWNVVRELQVVVPTLEKQREIGETIVGIDEVLATLRVVVGKKRTVMRSIMDRLVTGRTRLQGHGDEWRSARLGDLGRIKGGGVDKAIVRHERPVRLINYLDVYHNRFLRSHDITHVVTASDKKISQCSIAKGDVLFTPTSEVHDDIGRSAVAVEDMTDVVYSYHLCRLRLREDWDLRFLGYVFDTASFRRQANTLSEGSGTRYVITLTNFLRMMIQFPSSIDEQRDIANLLLDMEDEVDALERVIMKIEFLKRGVIQLIFG